MMVRYLSSSWVRVLTVAALVMLPIAPNAVQSQSAGCSREENSKPHAYLDDCVLNPDTACYSCWYSGGYGTEGYLHCAESPDGSIMSCKYMPDMQN